MTRSGIFWRCSYFEPTKTGGTTVVSPHYQTHSLIFDSYPTWPCQAKINLALADLRYVGNLDTTGDKEITVTCSDDFLEGRASSIVTLAWPRGEDTRPPTLSFRSPMIEMEEDGSILLDPVRIKFGDGQSTIKGRVTCSVGVLKLADNGSVGSKGVEILEGDGHDGNVLLRGLPEDVAAALSAMTYAPPQNWSSNKDGAALVTIEVQATAYGEVRPQ